MAKNIKKKVLKLLLKLCLAALGFCAVTCVVYFYNLDMKLTAAMEPVLTWWYDNKVKRDQHL